MEQDSQPSIVLSYMTSAGQQSLACQLVGYPGVNPAIGKDVRMYVYASLIVSVAIVLTAYRLENSRIVMGRQHSEVGATGAKRGGGGRKGGSDFTSHCTALH